MSTKQCLGILLPDDGPQDYEWHTLEQIPGLNAADLPAVTIGRIASDGHHEHDALTALGAVKRLASQGRTLVHDGADAIIWACTSASFIGGLEWAKTQVDELESVLGVPVTSTALAFQRALADLDYRQVDILSPYPDAVTERLIDFLRECGVTVGRVKALDCAYAAGSHDLDIQYEVRLFCKMYGDSSIPLLVPDTAINTLALGRGLNQDAERLVLTANQVSLWAALRLMEWDRLPSCIEHLA